MSQPCVVWDDQTGEVLEGSLEGFDTVIHLAGAGIGDKRWNAERKALIRSSRTVPTENLVRLSQPSKRHRKPSSPVPLWATTATEATSS